MKKRLIKEYKRINKESPFEYRLALLFDIMEDLNIGFEFGFGVIYACNMGENSIPKEMFELIGEDNANIKELPPEIEFILT